MRYNVSCVKCQSFVDRPMYQTWKCTSLHSLYGPLTRYVKLRVAHAPGMPVTFPPPPRVSDPDMHHGTCVSHAPWCMQRSQTRGFLSRWRGKHSRHSRRMHNPQYYVSGKRPMCHIRIGWTSSERLLLVCPLFMCILDLSWALQWRITRRDPLSQRRIAKPTLRWFRVANLVILTW